MQQTFINLKVLLPFQIFAEKNRRIAYRRGDNAMARSDSYRHRLDCARHSFPGILMYENETDGEVFCRC